MFDAADLDELRLGYIEALNDTRALKERCILHKFAVQGAQTHAHHGLARRLDLLSWCVERVFEVLPPESAEIPDRGPTTEATTHIQAFVMNAFGACENIAWIWVLERDVRQANGNPLLPMMIGLGENYWRVRNALTPNLLELLERRREWFTSLKDFRDALAHRIPLYIPPFMIDPDDGDEYTALDHAASQALLAGDLAAYAQHTAARDKLRYFKPVMAHDLQVNPHLIVFHAQLLADLNTINEISAAFLDEL